MIAIIDYNAGNLRSVGKAFENAGALCKATSLENEILNADAVVLPGVGAFKDCVNNLTERGLDVVVKKCIDGGMPFLGICLGFQMLFDYSEENHSGDSQVKGLGIFKGAVKQFSPDMGLKVPHMGWNSLDIIKDRPLFEGLPEKSFVYFVHSYYVDSEDRSLVSACTEYGVRFDAAVSRGKVHAVQFHPEKSGDIGQRIIHNFVKAVYSK